MIFTTSCRFLRTGVLVSTVGARYYFTCGESRTYNAVAVAVNRGVTLSVVDPGNKAGRGASSKLAVVVHHVLLAPPHAKVVLQ